MKRGSDWMLVSMRLPQAAVTKGPFCLTARVGIAGSADSWSSIRLRSHVIKIKKLITEMNNRYLDCSTKEEVYHRLKKKKSSHRPGVQSASGDASAEVFFLWNRAPVLLTCVFLSNTLNISDEQKFVQAYNIALSN
ncbi:hypothetical protein QTP88_021654 [Uroleucon formosanum]